MVPARHSSVTSHPSLQGHLQVGYSIRHIWAQKVNLISSGCFQFSCLFPLHLLHVCVFHHCEVMMNRWPTKQRRAGERQGEEKRSCLCLFIALFHHGNHLIYSENFFIHLLLSLAKPIFCVHHLAVSLSLRMFVYCHRNRENVGSSLQAGCTWALINMNSHMLTTANLATLTLLLILSQLAKCACAFKAALCSIRNQAWKSDWSNSSFLLAARFLC